MSASLSIRVDVGRNGAFTFAVLVPVEAARRLVVRRRDTCRLVGVQRGARKPRIAKCSHRPARHSGTHMPIDEPVRAACAKRRHVLDERYLAGCV